MSNNEKFVLNPRNLSILMLVLAAFFWGSTFLFSKFLIDSMSVYEILFGRSIIAALIIYIAYRKNINSEISAAFKDLSLWFFCIAAIIALALQTESLKYTSAANSAFITAMFIVFIPFLKLFVLKENIKHSFWGIVILAVTGLYVISFGFSAPTSFNYGDFLALLCSLFYAFYILILEKLAKKFSGGTLMFTYFALQAVISIITVILSGNFISLINLNINQIINLVALAIIGSAIPYILMALGQKNVRSQVASIIYNLEPVSATLLAYLFLGEGISLAKAIGCGIIFIALAISTLI